MDELTQFIHLPLAVYDGVELNINEVGRRTRMHYTSVERHLEALS